MAGQRYVRHVLRRYDNALHIVDALVGLAFEYAQRESYNLLAVSRINVRSAQSALLYGVNALSWQCVNTKEADIAFQMQFLGSLVSSECSKVAMTEHDVHILAVLYPLSHNALAVVIRPLARHMMIIYIRILADGIAETCVTLRCR